MDESDLALFEKIKLKAEKDKVIWNEAQEEGSGGLSSELEEEMMERQFLVYYVQKYLNIVNS